MLRAYFHRRCIGGRDHSPCRELRRGIIMPPSFPSIAAGWLLSTGRVRSRLSFTPIAWRQGCFVLPQRLDLITEVIELRIELGNFFLRLTAAIVFRG